MRSEDGRGTLYVVATPIGNLADISSRALSVLADVDCIAAEDTRHSKRLLNHYGIRSTMLALHDHNEREMAAGLLARLNSGQSIALISDAGTPLISDPGFHLVREARAGGIRVIPVPGPSALISALSVSGLPTDRFVFEGFLPVRTQARRDRLALLAGEPRTLVFYESSHRIVSCLEDLVSCFGTDRQAVLARELTKVFETILEGMLADLVRQVTADPNQQKGEFVLVVHGASPAGADDISAETERILRILLGDLPVKQAAGLAAKITGSARNRLYALALEMGRE